MRKMTDPIDRQEAIDALDRIFDRCEEIEAHLPEGDPDRTGYKMYPDYMTVWKYLRQVQPERRWIPVKTRPMTDEERKETSEFFGYDIEYEGAVVFTGEMPKDGQEVWVCSKCGNVWQDTCVVDEGFGLEENGDWLDIVAWMPFERPEPWKGEDNAPPDK